MWPLFPQRYAAETLPGPPEYRDLLVVLLVALLGIAAFLVTRLGQKGTAHTLQLVTQKPRNIVTIVEYRVPVLQWLTGTLFAVIQSGLLILLLLPEGSVPGGFWGAYGQIILGVLALFGLHLLVITWIGHTFAAKSEADLLVANVLILYILFGASLTVPILLLAFFSSLKGLLLLLSGALYLVWRIWFVGRAVAVLPLFRRAPLLIILYLCACELAPLYLLPSIALDLFIR